MTVPLLIGLVVNPVAGLGGAAGLKGSDGSSVQSLARERGAVPRAGDRAVAALQQLPRGTTVLTVAGAMGEAAVRAAGLEPVVEYRYSGDSTPADTSAAVTALVNAGAGLVLFAGGDGTACDVATGLLAAVPGRQGVRPVLGIPAGVKMYSSCFAVSAAAAGRIAAAWLEGAPLLFEAREVLDVDEDQVRVGNVEAVLRGLVPVPVVRGRTQARKTATATSEDAALRSVAAGVRNSMRAGQAYLLGPGSTMRAVAEGLGIEKTPLGFDAVRDGQCLLRDASERQLLELIEREPCHAVVTVIGGQGFLLGRGNQQLSPTVLRRLAEPKLIIAATQSKLLALPGPLLIDTGDATLDARLAGHYRVIVSAQETAVVAAVAASEQPRRSP